MLCWPALAAAILIGTAIGVAGCGADSPGADHARPSSPIDITADSNRDGKVDASDNDGEDVWSLSYGAAFLPNIDDDNRDGIADADDGVVNITADDDADRLDLAPLVVKAWPEAPDGTTATVTLDALSIKHVRVFKPVADGSYELVGGSDGPCGAGGDGTCFYWNGQVRLTTQDLRAGVTLGIEGRRLVGLPDSVSVDPATNNTVEWNGLLTLSYSIFEAGSSTPMTDEQTPDGVDTVQLRVSPWLMYGNLSENIDTIYANTPSSVFLKGIAVATTDDGMESLFNNACVNCFWRIGNWPDHWTEDWMNTGYVAMPAADGAVQGIRLTNPRPWGRGNFDSDLPVNWIMKNHVEPDRGAFVVYKRPHTGDSYDSHGNHDLIPAYSHNGANYPYGRIIYGSGILPETKAFYEKQLVQAPALTVKTSWLVVGHVDEVFSYVPANTARGWKLLVGSPSLARTMLTQWKNDGHGGKFMFSDKRWTDQTEAKITIDQVLADTDLMAWSQQGQAEIDGMVAVMKTELGLADDEIVEIPYLFERDHGALVAYNPGTVNSLVFNGRMVIPDPFGPTIDNEDGFKKDLMVRLGTDANQLGADGTGMKVYFADDWDLYHRLLGEVHCGTNQEAPPAKWWGAAQ